MTIEKTICDRCGKEIIYDPDAQARFPVFYIQKTVNFGESYRVDLCRACSISLTTWLSSYTRRNGGTKDGSTC